MRTVKVEEFQDKDGVKLREIIDDGTGIPKEVILLVEPSQLYKDTVLKPADEAREAMDKEVEKSRKIQDKLKEIAERELAEEK